jgi:RimJ/RimL family protein N-acetyltransferase
MTAPQIRTERLILRPPVEEDFEEWAAFSADPLVMEHLGGPQPRAVAWRMMAMHAGSWQLRGYGLFSVIEHSSGAWLGRAGPWRPEGWPEPEIGWSLRRDAWGKGYATEAARAAMEWAFDVLGWVRVRHYITRENAASIAVAERLGSRYLGETILPPPSPSELLFLVYGQDKLGRH